MFLLQLRHWQVFLLVFILPFALQYVLLQLLANLHIRVGTLPTILIDALPATAYALWLWRVGLWLYRRLPQNIKITPLYFHLGTVYILLYTLLFVYTMAVVRDSMAVGTLPLGMLALLLPMHLFATFCYLYAVYFVARSLASVEEQRVVDLGEYIGTYFFLLLLPLGTWFLQPRLRQLYFTRG